MSNICIKYFTELFVYPRPSASLIVDELFFKKIFLQKYEFGFPFNFFNNEKVEFFIFINQKYMEKVESYSFLNFQKW